MNKMEIKSDKYKKSRGGHSRFLDIRCRKCDSRICFYQKDGPGNLRRMYIDRINAPTVSISNKTLTCPDKHILAVKMVYEKENRPAFRLFVDSVTKKIVKQS